MSAPSVDATDALAIVAIGASAGGLEALEAFVRNVPPASGVAYIVVQHLDPTQATILAALLQRSTPMPVAEVVDGSVVEPDHVYVIPPNADLSLFNGRLQLTEPPAARGVHMPIDHCFRSLALHSEMRAVAVVLSGMGSDGTQGVRAIVGHGGLAFAQSPETAAYAAMPQSAMDTGLLYATALAEELPAQIVRALDDTSRTASSLLGASRPPTDVMDERAAEKVLLLLRTQTGQDFSQYKRQTVYRRIERRMALHQIDSVPVYARYLQENPQETTALFQELLIGVTSFFRDAAVWDALAEQLLPLLDGLAPGEPFRAWVTACSTGEEAYSLAILVHEAIERLHPTRSIAVQIFATDIDRTAIERARGGAYSHASVADLSATRRERFFERTESGLQVTKAIRESVIFATHNVSMDPPFTKLDVICCRNLLIYLTPALQQRLIPVFHYSLRARGLLLLGSSETIGHATTLFAPLGARARLYRRIDARVRSDSVIFPTTATHELTLSTPKPAVSKVSLQSAAEHLLLRRFAPAAVLTDAKGDIVFISGRTGRFLEPASGTTNWSLFAMAREGLRFELIDACRQAATHTEPVVRRRLPVGPDADRHVVDLTVQLLREPEALRGLTLVVFAECTPTPATKSRRRGTAADGARVLELEEQLARAHAEVQSLSEESRSVREDAHAATEELQSTNEELQSTNEELTTSKEELQSMNEELQTLNRDLQGRVDDLSRVSSDMRNLLESSELAMVFLDVQLRIRLFTSGSSRIFQLHSGDAGRPITDFASELDYDNLAADAREVFRLLVAKEQEATARDGRRYLVRMVPYRTVADTIEGVAISFTDVSAFKHLETELRTTTAALAVRVAAESGASGTAPALRGD